jgi:predicted transcriptional regulator
MDDPKLRKIDGRFVGMEQPHEARYWRNKFSCTKQALAYAVIAVGVSASKVKAYIREMRKIPK